MMTVEETLTALEHATWVVDRSGAGPILDANSRVTNRGRRRQGLDGRLFLILMIVAAGQGRVTFRAMHKIATGQLPRPMQWELGILRRHPKSGAVIELSYKQVSDMGARLSQHLSARDPKLPENQRAARLNALQAISDLLLVASHAMSNTTDAFAVDETGVWSWAKGTRAPADAPLVHPGDEDAQAAAAARADHAAGKASGHPLGPDLLVDEDVETDTAEPNNPNTGDSFDPDAKWGVKTHKSGGRSSYFGYSMHTLVRVPPMRDGKPDLKAGPLYIERLRLTAASTDVVDVTLDMIDKVRAGGTEVKEIIGDRHYSYKGYDRWAKPLLERGIWPVHDLRKNDHGAVDLDGAKIIAGTPHCPGTPQHLETVERPGLGASPEEWARFNVMIEERQRYAMRRHSTPLGDGKSRWVCPAKADKLGCPLVAGTTQVARNHQLPVVVPPPGEPPRCCTVKTAMQIPATKVMKYTQEWYWGTPEWELRWNRRTYVESVFGNLKNPNTENVHRGFVQVVGLPLMTIAMTAAAVSYNIREFNNWVKREDMTMQHRLLERTEWQSGHEMLTPARAQEIDDRYGVLQVA